jgi:hypothetical protein
MLTVTYKFFMLSVIMLNVIRLLWGYAEWSLKTLLLHYFYKKLNIIFVSLFIL